MTWNHRVCKETIESGGRVQESGEKFVEYTLREAYYNSAGELCAVTVNDPPIGVYAIDEFYAPETKPTDEDMLKEMKETVERFEKALSKPIVDLDTIVWAKWDNEDED